MIIDNHHVYIRPGFKPRQSWAVFIDRDGTINQEKHLIYKPKDFALIPQAAAAINKLNQNQIPVIIIHNAAVVARNLCSESQVQKINQLMIDHLAEKQAHIDAVFYCPHHSQAYNPAYLKDCHWRKPNPGMLQAAARQFNLHLSRSFVIGDMARDVLAGQAVSAKTILVKTGHQGQDPHFQARPDKTCQNILTAVNWILKL